MWLISTSTFQLESSVDATSFCVCHSVAHVGRWRGSLPGYGRPPPHRFESWLAQNPAGHAKWPGSPHAWVDTCCI
ncbi:hypothetical protein B0H67DRAFT_571954 [Lasiosphaeris hirsuta]|uniref:Uncharacterized protein n=1 Tax=Lasiosphaeris hirsuta TaxID=260670 RepID=A0AA40B1I0_9PEZI|nr:hypothetical protein B0H67DRAFT_571954 [Lasiosphaeris hirsuta]